MGDRDTGRMRRILICNAASRKQTDGFGKCGKRGYRWCEMMLRVARTKRSEN